MAAEDLSVEREFCSFWIWVKRDKARSMYVCNAYRLIITVDVR